MMAGTKRDERREGPARKAGPERTCAGCGQHAAPEELVRVVLDPSSGELAVDLAAGGFGRGSWVHPSAPCVTKAIKGGFAKSFKAKVSVEPQAFGEQLVRAADRRIEGLLGGARRGKLVAVGTDAVKDAIVQQKAELVVVATDAAAAARQRDVEDAVAQGRAIAWNEKLRLGALFGRDEVAVCAVLHPGLAEAIKGVFRASRPFTQSAGSASAWWSREVR